MEALIVDDQTRGKAGKFVIVSYLKSLFKIEQDKIRLGQNLN
jgi:hypothetical protein